MRRTDLRFALDALTKHRDDLSHQKRKRLHGSEREWQRPSWTNSTGVVGFGIGQKLVRASPTGLVAVKVYVRKKIAHVTQKRRVTEQIDIPGLDLPVLTDVEEVGDIHLHSLRSTVRPLVPGYSVSHPNCQPGTIGCFVRVQGEQGIFLLSSAHVIANFGQARPGDPVYQAARGDLQDGDRLETHRIGSVHAHMQPSEASGYPNIAEAALARVIVPVQMEVPEIGMIANYSATITEGMRVRMVGRTSGYSEGLVRDIDFRLRLPYGPGMAPRQIGFWGLVLCTPYATDGDSGAAVCSTSGALLGLHFAGSPARSIFARIAPVITTLGIDLPRSAQR